MSDNNEQNIPEVKTKAKQFYKIYQGIKFDKEHKHSHSKQSFFDSCSSLIDMQFGQHIPSEAMHRQEMKERELKLQLEKDLNDSIESLLAERNKEQKKKSNLKKTCLTKSLPKSKETKDNLNQSINNENNCTNIKINREEPKSEIKKNKPKYIDFLNRSIQHTKERQAKIEQMKKESINDGTLNLQDKPTLSHNTKEIVKKIHRKPLYQKPPCDSIEKLEDRFRELYRKECQFRNRSSEARTQKNYDNFYNNQLRWVEKKQKNIEQMALSIKNSSDANQEITTSYPKMNNTSVIIERVRQYQSTSPYKNKPRYEQMYYHYMENHPPLSTSQSKTSVKHSNLHKRCISLNNISYNKNISSSTRNNKKVKLYKTKPRAKSNEENKTQSNPKSKKKKQSFISWVALIADPNLNKKTAGGKADVLYKINVRQDLAWNENCLNKVMMKIHDKEIVNDFLG